MKRKYTLAQVKPTIDKLIKKAKIEFIGNGNHSDAYSVNDELVFKFPRHKKASTALEKEIELLKKLQGFFEIEIPNVIFEGNFEEFKFFASKKLRGQSLSKEEFLNLPKNKLDEAAKTLANFLKTLHKIQPQINGLVTLHGDFSLNHVLFENGKVVGILDFGDSRIGRPKSDFAYLLDNEDDEEFGIEFGLKVQKYYNQLQ